MTMTATETFNADLAVQSALNPMFPRLDPAVVHQVIVVLSAHNCNPNGDPAMNNEPRKHPFNERGIISAVSVKRKIRDYADDKLNGSFGNDILVRRGGVLASTVYSTFSKAGISVTASVEFSDEERAELIQAGEALPDAFTIDETGVSYDQSLTLKALGAVWKALETAQTDPDIIEKLKTLIKKKDDKAGQDALKASLEAVRHRIPVVMIQAFLDARVFGYTVPGSARTLCGPVQVTDFESIAPINIVEIQTVTTVRQTTSEKDGRGNFGSKHVVDHAVYVGTVHVNPSLAAETGVSAEDLGTVLEGLYYGQSLARSATRSDVRVEAMIVMTHNSKYGSMPYHQLEKRLKVTHDGLYDVNVEFDTGQLNGVTVTIIR